MDPSSWGARERAVVALIIVGAVVLVAVVIAIALGRGGAAPDRDAGSPGIAGASLDGLADADAEAV